MTECSINDCQGNMNDTIKIILILTWASYILIGLKMLRMIKLLLFYSKYIQVGGSLVKIINDLLLAKQRSGTVLSIILWWW